VEKERDKVDYAMLDILLIERAKRSIFKDVELCILEGP